jgi:tetratricopeptide (TPR) repeat protein
MHMRFRFTVARAVVLAAGLAVAASACGQYSISNIRALKAFKDANELYRKADYRGAIDLYKKAFEHNPDFMGITYFFIGNSYDQLYKPSKQGDPANDENLLKAVENYRLAIEKIKDTDPDAQKYKRWSYEWLVAAYGVDKLNDISKAEPVVRELVAMDPNEPSNYQAMAKLYEEANRLAEAEAQFKKAVEVKPNDPYGHTLLAGFYNRQGRFEETMQAFENRANLEPNNPEAWHNIGAYYHDKIFQEQKLKRMKDSVLREYAIKGIEAENKALSINSEYYDAIIFKNILLREQAYFEKDPAVQKRLTNEAEALYKKGEQIKAKQTSGDASRGAGS